MTTILYILGLVAAFMVGYYFCRHYNGVKISHFCMDLLIELFNGKISVEEAKKRWRETNPGD